MDLNLTNSGISRRLSWLACPLGASAAAAILRKWQLGSAFEPDTGLATPGSPASVVLTCVLVMAVAWFTILALSQPVSDQPRTVGQAGRWDLVFLDTGDLVYPILVLLAAFLALAAAPILLKTGIGQWQTYQEAVAAKKLNDSVQLPSNNGALTIATALGTALSFLGLLQMGRDGLHAGRRGKGGFSATLPGVAGCVWLMESFRAHAADPVRWDYAPLLLAIVCGMLLYMDFAGMSAGSARPRRLLWVAAMTLVLSAPALTSALTEKAWGDTLLLGAQCLTAAAVLWRLPPNLENPPPIKGTPIPRTPGETSIQEETTDE